MKLKLSLIVSILITSIGLISWESFWRSNPERYTATIDDDRYLWGEHRAKVESATSEDIVIIGSSRTGFNFNTHIWEKTQGIKPINLSTNGKPPGPFFVDLIENTNFKGTLVVGITPLFWFSIPNNQRWQDATQWVDHYHNQTYSQKLGHQLSKPLQRNLVMLTASELNFYNDLDLKSLVNRFTIPGRLPESKPLYNFSYHDEDRNLMMFPIMMDDPDFSNSIKEVWSGFLPNIPTYNAIKDDIPKIIEGYRIEIEKFKARGGKIIFVLHKAEEPWRKVTDSYLPREHVWDVFVKTVDCPTYHFEDYSFMSKHTLPDWSHMYTEDAKIYTKDFVEQLLKDGHLKLKSTK